MGIASMLFRELSHSPVMINHAAHDAHEYKYQCLRNPQAPKWFIDVL